MRAARPRNEAAPHDSRASDDVQSQVPNPDLRDLQLVELSILREFVRVCETRGLRYYIAYGTLLGAVRHRGFIPWDDDIDVTMPRRDYDQFAAICASVLQPGFSWQSYGTDSRYPFLFGKLLRDDTVLRQRPTEHLPVCQSVPIDVFPLDGRAVGPWAVFAQIAIVRICRVRLGAEIRRRPWKWFLAQWTRVIPRKLAIAVFVAMTRSRPADKSTMWICAGGPYGYDRQWFPSQWFGSGSTQAFEDLTVVGPAEWDEYLTLLYGDYMSPPPVSDQLSHHEVIEIRLPRG